MVQEGTFRSDGYIDILNFQKNGGRLQKREGNSLIFKELRGDYNIEINILAVNRYESLLSCFEREQFFQQNNLPPRAVTIENHDDSYEKMLKTINIVEQRKLFDKMKVYRRGYIEDKPELIYVAGNKRFPSTAEAVKHERRMQEITLFNDPEPFLKRINNLKKKIKDNNSLLFRLQLLENDFIANLDRYKKCKTID